MANIALVHIARYKQKKTMQSRVIFLKHSLVIYMVARTPFAQTTCFLCVFNCGRTALAGPNRACVQAARYNKNINMQSRVMFLLPSIAISIDLKPKVYETIVFTTVCKHGQRAS